MNQNIHNEEREDIQKLEPSSQYSSPWGTFDFGKELFDLAMERLRPDLGIVGLGDIIGGYSGSRTFRIQTDGSGSVKKGRYILKVSLLGKAEQEMEKHRTARENHVLRRYVPDLMGHRSYPDLQLAGILYQVAGNDELTRTTFQEELARNSFQLVHIQKLAHIMLRWNLEERSAPGRYDPLQCIRDGLGEERLNSLKERLRGIVDQIEEPRVDLRLLENPANYDENLTYYNPVHFLLNQDACPPLEKIRLQIPSGILHGDLHPGNVILPIHSQKQGSFHVIDFAAMRKGNAFFDVAYLEISILLNSFNGYQSIADLKNWWQLEKALNMRPQQSFSIFDVEGSFRVMPVRRALAVRSRKDNLSDNYRIAFLVASVEAGLELARKLYRDRFRQRMAFLTAVSRFHHLVELLKASDKDLQRMLEITRVSLATIYRPDQEPPLAKSEREEKKKEDLQVNFPLPKIGFVFPGEINRLTALHDPWGEVKTIWNSLTGENDQGILLLGERKFGKTSFFNCAANLFPRNEGSFKTIRIDTINQPQTITSFATKLLEKLCNRVEYRPVPYDKVEGVFDHEKFLELCESIVETHPEARFVVFVDEIDSALLNAKTPEDARDILHLLDRLLTHPILPVRLLLTASNIDILRTFPGGGDFVDNLGIRKIHLCSEDEVKDLIERFDLPLSLSFEPDTFNRIFYYSGGQIYLIKFIIEASIAQAGGRGGKTHISAALVDEIMHAAIWPHASAFPQSGSWHETVFRTMKDIYDKHFTDRERRFMRALTEAGGTLHTVGGSFHTTDGQINQEQLVPVADTLFRRGYINKTVTARGEEYTWRIGVWSLFTEHRFHLDRTRSQKR
jgi:hypothetical protein